MLENENMIDFIGSLKEMPSEQLSQLIQEETAKECPNDELVLMALDILENQEKEKPIDLGPKGKAAWKKYQSKVHSRRKRMAPIWKPLLQVASVLVVITLLFTLLPTQANAETWWERLARWTDELFSFFNSSETQLLVDEYVFQTDHAGLQQLYDTVVELGVTKPVVPMWLPTGYELGEIRVDTLLDQNIVSCVFINGNNAIVYQIIIFSTETYGIYHKDETEVVKYEKYGTVHNIMYNLERKTIVWTDDNVECAMSMDCQEEDLYKVIDSIYRWRPIS